MLKKLLFAFLVVPAIGTIGSPTPDPKFDDDYPRFVIPTTTPANEILYRNLVIGGVLGFPAALVLIFLMVICCCRRSRRKHVNYRNAQNVAHLAVPLVQNKPHNKYANVVKEAAHRAHQTAIQHQAAEHHLIPLEEIIIPIFHFEKKSTPFVPSLEANYAEIDPARLELLEELGSGTFSFVHKANLVTRQKDDEHEEDEVITIAVKSAKQGENFDENCRALEKELAAICSLDHPHKNVIELVGAATQSRDFYHLAFEFYPQGSLLDFLRRHRQTGLDLVDTSFTDPSNDESSKDDAEDHERKQLTRGDLLKIASQIAEAMKFLHETKRLHIDLQASHVLIANGRIPKITGFGTYRQTHRPNSFAKIPPEPWRWSAPEVLSQLNPYFHEGADVWSFGVLLWEMMTLGDLPYSEFDEQPEDFVHQLKHLNKRLSKPELSSDAIYAVMSACWNDITFDRPKFLILSKQLKELHGSHEPAVEQPAASVALSVEINEDHSGPTSEPSAAEIVIEIPQDLVVVTGNNEEENTHKQPVHQEDNVATTAEDNEKEID